MALVRGVDASRSHAIARRVLSICFELDIAVIAEGIKTAAEQDFFFDEGVALMQEYLFCRPALHSLGTVTGGAWPVPLQKATSDCVEV